VTIILNRKITKYGILALV